MSGYRNSRDFIQSHPYYQVSEYPDPYTTMPENYQESHFQQQNPPSAGYDQYDFGPAPVHLPPSAYRMFSRTPQHSLSGQALASQQSSPGPNFVYGQQQPPYQHPAYDQQHFPSRQDLPPQHHYIMHHPTCPQAQLSLLSPPIARMVPVQQQALPIIEQQVSPIIYQHATPIIQQQEASLTIQQPVRQASSTKSVPPPWPTTGIPTAALELEAFTDREELIKGKHNKAESARRFKEVDAWDRMRALLPAIKSQRTLKEQAVAACNLFEGLESGNRELQGRIAELYVRKQKARMSESGAEIGESVRGG